MLSSDDKDVVNSALNGDLASARQLGEEHFDSDFARARPWLELAVELGDIESSYLLGVGLKNLREQEVAVCDSIMPHSHGVPVSPGSMP